MKTRMRSSYAAALNSQSASLARLAQNAVFETSGKKAIRFLILIPDLRVFGSRQSSSLLPRFLSQPHLLTHFDDCKEIASTRGIRCELSTAARFWLAQGGQEQTSLLSPQLNYGGRNHEKNAIDHCLGSSGVVCVGTDATAAAYEDARRAEAAAANHKHDRHHY
jgi:hypothetical protein